MSNPPPPYSLDIHFSFSPLPPQMISQYSDISQLNRDIFDCILDKHFNLSAFKEIIDETIFFFNQI